MTEQMQNENLNNDRNMTCSANGAGSPMAADGWLQIPRFKFAGKVDDLGIRDHVLAAMEISELAATDRATRVSDLPLWAIPALVIGIFGAVPGMYGEKGPFPSAGASPCPRKYAGRQP